MPRLLRFRISQLLLQWQNLPSKFCQCNQISEIQHWKKTWTYCHQSHRKQCGDQGGQLFIFLQGHDSWLVRDGGSRSSSWGKEWNEGNGSDAETPRNRNTEWGLSNPQNRNVPWRFLAFRCSRSYWTRGEWGKSVNKGISQHAGCVDNIVTCVNLSCASLCVWLSNIQWSRLTNGLTYIYPPKPRWDFNVAI